VRLPQEIFCMPLDYPTDNAWLTAEITMSNIVSLAEYNPRGRSAEREWEMSISLATYGQMDSIIAFLRDSLAYIVAGHTRYHAAIILKWESLRVYLKKGEMTALELMQYGGITNILRTNLTVYEKVQLAMAYAKERAVSIAQACRELHIHERDVSNCRWLFDPNCPPEIVEMVQKKELTAEMVALLRLVNANDRLAQATALKDGTVKTSTLKQDIAAAKSSKSDDSVTIEVAGKKIRIPKDAVTDAIQQLRKLEGK
jgi:ParB-like chromosome segregation protein Spo0J